MANELDLKTLLEHDFRMILNTIDTARKLVLDVQASHYWTVHAIENFTSLKNIGANVDNLLQDSYEYLAQGSRAFREPKVMKLWKTVVGLYRAMPPVQKKFADQLTRRRRERIMGEEIIQPEEIGQDIIEADLLKFTALSDELTTRYLERLAGLALLPDGLIPDRAAVEADIERERQIRLQTAATRVSPEAPPS